MNSHHPICMHEQRNFEIKIFFTKNKISFSKIQKTKFFIRKQNIFCRTDPHYSFPKSEIFQYRKLFFKIEKCEFQIFNLVVFERYDASPIVFVSVYVVSIH